MEDHVPGVIVECEVVFRQGGLPGVEGGLIAESVGAVTQRGSEVDHRTKERTLIRGGEGEIVIIRTFGSIIDIEINNNFSDFKVIFSAVNAKRGA